MGKVTRTENFRLVEMNSKKSMLVDVKTEYKAMLDIDQELIVQDVIDDLRWKEVYIMNLKVVIFVGIAFGFIMGLIF